MPSFMGAHQCTKILALGLISLVVFSSEANWSVDMSRRQQDFKRMDSPQTPARGLASVYEAQVALPGPGPDQNQQAPNGGFLKGLFEASGPTQEVVILNTDKGFVPKTLRLQKDGHYEVRVVNINDERKNLSFILDAFSEHHGTYFGKMKSFVVTPKAEGVFSFHCPETGAEGQIVVTERGRMPASQ